MEGTEGPVFDFGPDGLQFTAPVSLSLAYDGTPAVGKKAVIAWLDEASDKWMPVEGSTVADGKVTGEITHFTKFSVVIIDDEAFVISECGDLVAGFTACGGALDGTWKVKDVCLLISLGENPFKECPGATWEGDATFDIIAEFNGGTLTTTMNKQVFSTHSVIPKSCLPDGAVCGDIFDDEPQWACTDTGSACDCNGSQESVPDEPVSTSTYTTNGGTVTFDDGKTMEYCVKGATLEAFWKDKNGTDQYLFVAEKQ